MTGSWKNNSKSMMQKTSKLSKSVIWRENTTGIVQNNFGSPLGRLPLRNSDTLTPAATSALDSYCATHTPQLPLFTHSRYQCYEIVTELLFLGNTYGFDPYLASSCYTPYLVHFLAKTCWYPCACMLMHSSAYAFIHTQSGSHKSRCIHWYKCVKTHERTHMNRHLRACTHLRKCTRAQRHAQAHIMK